MVESPEMTSGKDQDYSSPVTSLITVKYYNCIVTLTMHYSPTQMIR